MFEDIKPSEIRYVNDQCRQYKILNLSIGEPHLSIPWKIRRRAIFALLTNQTNYTENAGLIDLREKIAEKAKNYTCDEVIVTAGASQGLNVVLDYLVNPMDELLVLSPAYTGYSPLITIKKGIAIYSTIEELEDHVTSKTKAILFSNPNNPTGEVYSNEEMQKIIHIVLEYNLYVICEEIYSDLTYSEFHSISRFKEIKERLFLISSFSKNYSMTGLRLGYILSHKKHMKYLKLIYAYENTCANAIAQYAIVPWANILNRKRALFYQKRMNEVLHQLDEMHLSYIRPQAGFYVFIKYREDYAYDLLHRKLLGLVPGSSFGPNYKEYARMNISVSKRKLNKALKILKTYVGD